MIDEVAKIIRDVATVEVLQRFDRLAAGDISEKSPGDYVTIADQECERVLAGELRSIRDVPVVGEEATAADPSLPDQVDEADAVWIVDPVDGTANFVDGSTDFVVMVAYAVHGVTTAAWIWHPHTDAMVAAEVGSGTWRDGTRLRSTNTEAPSGILKHRYIPEPGRTNVAEAGTTIDLQPDRRCAGLEYIDLIDGASNLLFYWRTHPWDHAPGSLLASEAGLHVARLDNTPYRPGDGRRGLLTATPSAWPHIGPRLDAATEMVRP